MREAPQCRNSWIEDEWESKEEDCAARPENNQSKQEHKNHLPEKLGLGKSLILRVDEVYWII